MFPFIKKIWHSFLIFFLAIVFSYFFFFLFFHPLNLVYFFGDKLYAATITDSATVPENPINQLAMQLDDKQRQLDAQEQALNNRAAKIDAQNNFWNNGLLIAIFLALVTLGVLVIVNFYFDSRREKELQILAERDIQEKTLEEENKEQT
jgi:hypothetical protein